jgi:hypothetical protein
VLPLSEILFALVRFDHIASHRKRESRANWEFDDLALAFFYLPLLCVHQFFQIAFNCDSSMSGQIPESYQRFFGER